MLVSVDQLIGQTFGSYQLERLLGSGSLSAVFAASNTVSTPSSDRSRSVMVTVFTLPVACEGRAREHFVERFQQEARRLVRLSHPNIVPVYDFGEQFGYPYLVTPFTEGESLSTSLKKHTRYPPKQTLTLLQKMASALDYAHQNGSIHGSLKLSNVLLVGEQPQQQLYIAGFGLMRLLEMRGIGHVDHPYPHLFSVAGTLLVNTTYLAPEVIKGQVANARADVYALGIIIFELLTGRPPFVDDDPFVVVQKQLDAHRPSLQEICPDVSDELIALDLVLQRALEHDPALRLSSAGKLANAFKRALDVLEEAEHSKRSFAQPKKREEAQLVQKSVSISSTLQASIPVVTASNWLVSSSGKEDEWMKMQQGTTSAKLSTLSQAKDTYVQPVSRGLPGETGTWRGVPSFTSSQLASVPSAASSSIFPSIQFQQAQKSQQGQMQSNSLMQETGNRLPRRTTGEVAAVRSNRPIRTDVSAFVDENRFASDTRLRSQNPFATADPAFEEVPQAAGQERSNTREVVKPLESASLLSAKDLEIPGKNVSHDKKQLGVQEKDKPSRKTRRAILLASSVVAASVLGFGGVSVLHNLRGQGQQTTESANTVKKAGGTPAAQTASTRKPTTNNKANKSLLLGNKNTPLNTSKDFINPVDQKPSILVRLPSGDFVAYEKTCTHMGILVAYDTATQKLVCPLHHSIFDPAHNASVLSGPAPSPLPKVALQILPDGSVVAS